jgi:hypothetical protein
MTRMISTIAMRLKQIEEMLQASPGWVLAAVLRPSDAIATARTGTHAGTRSRSRREATQSSAAPTSSVAASVSLTAPALRFAV